MCRMNILNKMKNFLTVLLFLLISGNYIQSQIVLPLPNITPKAAVEDVLLGAGVSAFNITFNGNTNLAINQQNTVRKFIYNGAQFPLAEGILMHTESGNNISDPDLSAITNNTVTNGAIIEFDFIPEGDTLSFSYIFTSAEYQSYTCSNYNDVFGFFISGPGISGPFTNNAQNIATIPNSNNIPVGINTVNSGNNSDFSGNCANANPNWQSDSQYWTNSYNATYNMSGNPLSSYNGSTVELTANASVICGETYHIKLAISNVSDQALNSGVFLKAGSFSSEPLVELTGVSTNTSVLSDSVMVTGCDQGTFCFERASGDMSDTAIVHYSLLGGAIVFEDYSLPNAPNTGDSIIFLPGESVFCLEILPLEGAPASGIENVIISSFAVNACGDTTFTTAELWIAAEPELPEPDAGLDFVVCNGDAGTLNGTLTSAVNHFEWTYSGPGNVNFTPNTTDLNPEVSFDLPGEYIFFLTETNDTCSYTGMDSVIVAYGEVSITVSNDTTVCQNGEATLSASGIGGDALTYHWGHTSNTGSFQTVLPTEQTEYTVFVETEDGCVSEPETITVSVLPPLGITSSAWQSVCPGDSATLSATASGGNGGPYTYVWTNPNGVIVGNGPTIVVIPSETTIYTVTAEDNCESTPVSTTSEVNYDPLPEVLFSVTDPAICTPAVFEIINLSDTSLIDEMYWKVSNGTQYANSDTIEVEIAQAGLYNVELIIVTPNGCIDSATVTNMLEVYPLPKPAFSYYPSPVTILNTNVNFQNATTGAEYYDWTFEGGNPGYSSMKNPTSRFPEGYLGDYEVQLIATSEYNCVDTLVKIITVLPDVQLFVPNTFTPDGDGFNEMWNVYIQGVDIYNFTLEVFNRWGEKVWESHDIEYGWDGTYGGKIVPTGTYVWKIRAADYITDEKYEWNGHVLIMR